MKAQNYTTVPSFYNKDPQKKIRNAVRSSTAYERDGAPVMAAGDFAIRH
jgi:hypothetical protein